MEKKLTIPDSKADIWCKSEDMSARKSMSIDSFIIRLLEKELSLEDKEISIKGEILELKRRISNLEHEVKKGRVGL